MRELRPGRDNPLGSKSAADKWLRIRNTVAATDVFTPRSADKRMHTAHDAFRKLSMAAGIGGAFEQGDESLHVKKVWGMRMDLHTHPTVMEELHSIWTMLRNTFATAFSTEDELSTWALTETEYSKLQQRIYKALIHPFDPLDARKCAREDWKVDSRGGSTIGCVALYNSLFDLADLVSPPSTARTRPGREPLLKLTRNCIVAM